MNILNAVLAFAAYMVILSTLVSAIVELIFQYKDKRQSYFREIISRLFDDIIWPRLEQQILSQQLPKQDNGDNDNPNNSSEEKTKAKKRAKDNFVNAMVSVTGLRAVKKGESSKSHFSDNEKKTESLTSVEFASRFAKTCSGKIIYTLGKEKAEVIVADLVRSFEDLSVGSTSDFRTRASKWSLAVGFVLAFSLNIDAFQLFKELNSDPKVVEQVIAATSDQIKTMQEADNADNQKEHLDTIKDTLSVVGHVGLSVGWDYFPICKPSVSVLDSRCPKQTAVDEHENNNTNEPHRYVFWLLGLISTGIFVGLGSPFWFQVFQRMSMAAQLVRGIQSPQEKLKNNPGTVNQAAADPLQYFREPVEAYMLAAKAESILPSREDKSRPID